MWQRLQPLTPDLINKYTAKVDANFKPLDSGLASYQEWDKAWQAKFIGMRHLETGGPHGLVRKIASSGYLAEGSFKDGVEHGLVRTIYRGVVILALYEEGQELASITLNENLA